MMLLPLVQTRIAKSTYLQEIVSVVGSVVEWLERRAREQHGLSSKPTRAILLCPWERHFTPLSLLGGLGKQF